MQDCTRCGHQNMDDHRFCGQCGERLNNVCPTCKFPNLLEQAFCGQCGKQLLADEQIKPEQDTSQPRTAQRPARSGTRASQRLRALKMRGGFPEAQPIQTEATPQAPRLPLQEPAPPPTQPAAPKPAFSEVLAREAEAPKAGAGIPASQPKTPDEAESVRIPTYAPLEAYALISIELMNMAELSLASDDRGLIERFRRDCLAYLDDKVLTANGRVESSKNAILFVAFKQEPDLTTSLQKAVELSLGLLKERFQLQDVRLKLRIGLDIECPGAGPSITAVTERTVAPANTLVVSAAAFELLKNDFEATLIGPLPMGDRMVAFYRIEAPVQHTPMPSADALLGEPSVSEYQPRTEQILPKEVIPETAPVTPEPEPVAPPLAEEAPPPKPEEPPPPVETEPFPAEAPQAETPQPEPLPVSAEPEAGLSSLHLFEAPTEPIVYTAPAWLIKKATRASTVNYEGALEALYAELYGLLAEPGARGRAVSLSSPDGLGRSNLLGMVRGRLDPQNERATWLGGTCYRMFAEQPIPLQYWQELLQNLLGLIPEGQSEPEVQEIIDQFLRYVFDGELPEEMQAFLQTFLSVERLQPLETEHRELLGRIEHRLFELFSVLTQKRPLVLILEDLDYADPASLEVLVRLLSKGLLEKPVALVLTHQRNLYATGDLERLLHSNSYKELVLDALGPAEAERFLNDGPFGGNLSSLPQPLLDQLLAHAHGLPLYLEEASRLLHLQGVLTVNEETGKFVYAGVEAAPLPESVRNVITERMGFLSETSRYLLQLASVLGEKFPVALLMSLAQMDEDAFNETLTLLFEHGYLVPDVVNTGRFRHGLLWQAVYEGMRSDLRQRLHQLTSQALENDFQSLTVYPGLIAYHAEQGGLPKRAFHFWNLAGIHAAQSGSLTGMNLALFHALELVGLSPEGQLAALQIEENLASFNVSLQPELAEALLKQVIVRYQETGETARLLESLGLLATSYEQRGDYTQALEILDASLTRLPEQTYPLERASIQMTRMEYFHTLGRLQKARELMEREILPQSSKAGNDPAYLESFLHARLLYSIILLMQLDGRAFTLLEESLTSAREREMEGLCIALQLARAWGFLHKGVYDSCDREADGLLGQIEALEDPEWFLAQWGLLAMAYHCEMGDWDSARQLVLTVITKAEQSHDYLTLTMAQTYAGRIAYGLGNYKEAKKLLEQAVGKSSDFRFASVALLGWRALAETELALGAKEVAYEIASKALSVAQKPEIQHHHEAALLTNVCARCLLAMDDIKQAGKLLEAQWPKAVDSKYGPLIAETSYWIGELYRQMAQDAPSEVSRKHLERSVQFFSRSKTLWLEMKNRFRYQQAQEATPHV